MVIFITGFILFVLIVLLDFIKITMLITGFILPAFHFIKITMIFIKLLLLTTLLVCLSIT